MYHKRSLSTRLLLFISMLSCMATAPLSYSADGVKKAFTLQPYEATYEAKWNVGWFDLSIKGKRVLKKLEDQQWHVSFNASTVGAKLAESSSFTLVDNQIKPQSYQYRAGGFLTVDDQTITFDKDKKRLYDKENKREYVWDDRVFDPLTYMEQAKFDLQASKKTLNYTIYRDGKPRHLVFDILGRFWMKTPLGKLKTVKIRLIEGERITYAWFAEGYNYLMVRISEEKEGERVYDIRLKSVKLD